MRLGERDVLCHHGRTTILLQCDRWDARCKRLVITESHKRLIITESPGLNSCFVFGTYQVQFSDRRTALLRRGVCDLLSFSKQTPIKINVKLSLCLTN
jgi:hypothetical protein